MSTASWLWRRVLHRNSISMEVSPWTEMGSILRQKNNVTIQPYKQEIRGVSREIGGFKNVLSSRRRCKLWETVRTASIGKVIIVVARQVGRDSISTGGFHSRSEPQPKRSRGEVRLTRRSPRTVSSSWSDGESGSLRRHTHFKGSARRHGHFSSL